MAHESQQELQHKIDSLNERIEETKKRDNYNKGELARMELDLKRMKNLKGDEGNHIAADVEIPENITLNTPDLMQAQTDQNGSEKGNVVDNEGDKLGKKGAKASEEKKGAD